MRAADPVEEASALAERLGGVLCTTDDAVDAELDRRRAAGAAMDAEGLAALERLAQRLERAARIADRTRVRAETEVAEQLAGAGAGLAVHPTTIRDRATAVEVARRALEDAEVAVAAVTAHIGAEASEPPPDRSDGAPDGLGPRPATEPGAAPDGPSAGTRRHRAIGVVVAAIGLTLVLLGTQATALWLALVPVLAASLWAVRYLRPRSDDAGRDQADRAVASSLLAQVGASADELFSVRRAADDTVDGLTGALVRRDRAVEELRVADRAWHELAGPATDIDQLAEVVRRYDPQHEDSRLLAGEVVAVRAADVVLQGLEQQWRAAWSAAGAEPPAVSSANLAVEALRTTRARAVVLVGDAVDRAEAVVGAAPGAPVIVVEAATSGSG